MVKGRRGKRWRRQLYFTSFKGIIMGKEGVRVGTTKPVRKDQPFIVGDGYVCHSPTPARTYLL